MDEGFWAGGICHLPVSVSRAGECQVHEEIGSNSNSSCSSGTSMVLVVVVVVIVIVIIVIVIV